MLAIARNGDGMKETYKPLIGRLVLLIEEEPLLADHLGNALTDAGAQIIGPARTVAEARALLVRLRTKPLAAIVSMTLFDAEGGTVSNDLTRLVMPVLLIRKTQCRLLPSSMRHTVLPVPFAASQVVRHLCRLLEARTKVQMPPRRGAVNQGH